MGTTFINLQIKARYEEIPKDRIPSGYVLIQMAEEWSTVFETNGSFEWGEMCKLGRNLSKELEVPVIVVRYFEDEFFMSLLLQGKVTSSYQANVDRNFCSGPAKWISGLKLTAEEASAFRYLLKKEMSAEESISVFSRLFGASMYADLRMWDEQGTLWKNDAEGVIKEIAEEKKRTKVKNKTKAVLLQEIPGLFQDFDGRNGVLRMVYPDKEGEFLFSQIHCLDTFGDVFEEIYSYSYPSDLFRADSRALNIDYNRQTIMVMDVEGYVQEYKLADHEKRLTLLMEVPAEKRKGKENQPEFHEVLHSRIIST